MGLILYEYVNLEVIKKTEYSTANEQTEKPVFPYDAHSKIMSKRLNTAPFYFRLLRLVIKVAQGEDLSIYSIRFPTCCFLCEVFIPSHIICYWSLIAFAYIAYA